MLLLTFNYVAGIIIGCAMGYFGGAFDLLFQRVIEIWSNIPFLYVIMIVASVVVPSFLTLVIVMAALGWMQLTWNMRTSTYKEKGREYVSAAQALGAGNVRIIGSHILPNTIAVIVTFVPFSIASGITFLTALDYLGFGSTAANAELGRTAFTRHQSVCRRRGSLLLSSWQWLSYCSWWTYVGEAIREAFDPKQFTYYE